MGNVDFTKEYRQLYQPPATGFALVEVPAQEAERVASALNGMTIRRKRVTARVDRGGARPVRPARATKRT